jgi:4-amino-4-deoxy-L-arabinose transferase-like glycosyltransferase
MFILICYNLNLYMKKLIGIVIVILSIVGFFIHVTPDDLIDAPFLAFIVFKVIFSYIFVVL